MSTSDRFLTQKQTLSDKIRCNPVVSTIRYYPPNLCKAHKKNRTEHDISARFLVEVTGFEPATFWSRRIRSLSAFVRKYPLMSFRPRIKPDITGQFGLQKSCSIFPPAHRCQSRSDSGFPAWGRFASSLFYNIHRCL